MDFYRAKQYIINRLHTELNPKLVYHNLEHTLHVYHAAQDILIKENIDNHSSLLVLTAALFHDSGMLSNYENHEYESELICQKELPRFDYSAQEIELIVKMIRKTHVLESAETILEQILCDADLDYLGRDVFFIRSTKLLHEWKIMGKHNYRLYEWLKIQIEFLENHKYYTKTSKELRAQTKQFNIDEIKELYKICPDAKN